MNAQAANLFLIFGAEALERGSAEPAATLLRSLLDSDPAIFRKFCDEIDYHFPPSSHDPAAIDPRERACIESLFLAVPEILYFFPVKNDAIKQAVYRLLPITVATRDGSDLCSVVVDTGELSECLRPLLDAMMKTMVRAGFQDKTILSRVDLIIDQFAVDQNDRERFLP